MNAVFAGTSFYLALLNPRDRYHRSAVELARRNGATVTTEFVLMEVGNALSGNPRGRDGFVTLVDGSFVSPRSHGCAGGARDVR